MRENQNIAHCCVCGEKTHCRFFHAYISHRLHSKESKFQPFLSQNLPNNIGDICMFLIQNGRRFITHSPTLVCTTFLAWWSKIQCTKGSWKDANTLRAHKWSLSSVRSSIFLSGKAKLLYISRATHKWAKKICFIKETLCNFLKVRKSQNE